MQADPLQVPRDPVYVIAHPLGTKVHAPHVITKADAPNVYDWLDTVVTVVVGPFGGSHGSLIVSAIVSVGDAIVLPFGVTAFTVKEYPLAAKAALVVDRTKVRATRFVVTTDVKSFGVEGTVAT